MERKSSGYAELIHVVPGSLNNERDTCRPVCGSYVRSSSVLRRSEYAGRSGLEDRFRKTNGECPRRESLRARAGAREASLEVLPLSCRYKYIIATRSDGAGWL